VTAVAVFATRPDARTLLDTRLARGWRPTPSALKSGSQVLGYAACVVATHGVEQSGT
jgi:hypothetical protein